MHQLKECLRLKFECQRSHEQIARALGLSKGVVGKYVMRAQLAGLSWTQLSALSEAQIDARLRISPPAVRGLRAPIDLPWVHRELRRKGVILQLLWEEYRDAHPQTPVYQYTQFCQHYRDYAQSLRRSMRQVHRAGEKLFIDFAGATVGLVNPDTGERHSAHVFVAVLGASNYTYARATQGQTQGDWLHGINRALFFIGGVPALIVPDNPRALIARAGGHTTIAEHMPAAHRAHRDWSPSRFLHWAQKIGPATAQLTQYLLTHRPHPEMGYRGCLGLLALARDYGSPRLEAACARAMATGARTRRSVLSILKNGLDRQPLPDRAVQADWVSPVHDNLRGSTYYRVPTPSH
jgi:transposase